LFFCDLVQFRIVALRRGLRIPLLVAIFAAIILLFWKLPHHSTARSPVGGLDRAVLSGSPAQHPGLLPGDQITEINGWSTSNQPLASVVEAMHGVTAAR
jgi:membrane-associated protease RseP (regulator of RpoE activity)